MEAGDQLKRPLRSLRTFPFPSFCVLFLLKLSSVKRTVTALIKDILGSDAPTVRLQSWGTAGGGADWRRDGHRGTG